MSAGVFSPFTTYSVLLSLAIAALAGCEREASQADSAADAKVAAGVPPAVEDRKHPRASPAGETPAAASRPAPQLPDWVLRPLVDQAERDSAAPRIVSAAPNVTEICCALGLRAALVGRTRYCDYPPGIEEVPSIGALIDVNVERLLRLRPELLLVAGTSRTQIDRFAALDVRFESVPDTRLSDLFAAIERVGELTGRRRTAARLCRRIRSDLDDVTAHFADVTPARVLLLTGTLSDPPRPPYVAGPGSFYDDLLKRAGHANVVAGAQAAFAPLSLEFIVRADPDVVIELDADGSERPNGNADARRVWAKVGALRAVTDRRVHVLTGPEHYLLGPRIAFTYAALCRTIAGENHD